jgi:hypothetical protein
MFSDRRGCKFILGIKKRRAGIKRVSCELRPSCENKENKYASRTLNKRNAAALQGCWLALHRAGLIARRIKIFFEEPDCHRAAGGTDGANWHAMPPGTIGRWHDNQFFSAAAI